MDASPVIIDSATKFGRGLDKDRDFPGFPFDDEGFGRISDIRSHLDDLAARHPEFADQLLGPPWGDVPFPGGGGSLHRNRNRRSSGERPSASSFHNHPDEDARSQASGSSAASGASGVSSHGSETEEQSTGRNRQQIPQHGLRNTVDIGQHQHKMENPQQQRNVRSMSAPPENRNTQSDNNGQQQQQPGRFVSRVEITPQQQENQNQSPQQQPQREKSPAPQQQKSQPQSQQPQANVRHIPIFVEGRDKPVISKDVDETDLPKRQSPPQFHRPSHYQHHYNKPSPPGWSSHMQHPFFDNPTSRYFPSSQHSTPQFRHTQQQEKPRTQQTHHAEPQQKNQRQQKQQTQNETQSEAPPKPKPQIQPKDPLEKVAMVQKEVDSLAEQVKQYTGNSKTDKQYIYLDEMLTRELIKLDDIDTEGKENVRQARKQAIKSIQETISLLESKAPLPNQQKPEAMEEENKEPTESEKKKPEESIETSEEPASEEQKAIPLPPPSSPTKCAPEAQNEEVCSKNAQHGENTAEAQETSENITQAQQPEAITQNTDSNQANEKTEADQQNDEPMDNGAAPQTSNVQEMEFRQTSPVKELQSNTEIQKEQSQALISNEQKEENKDASAMETTAEEIRNFPVETTESKSNEKSKKEPPPVPTKPGKSPKKAKKTKQPEPISETAIPMPAPGHSI